jgi:hypothetical protein
MKNNKLIIYASYPKTGSTYIPDILGNINQSSRSNEISIEKFKFLKGKNNFFIRNNDDCNIMIKTHSSPSEALHRIKKFGLFELQGVATFLDDEIIDNCKIIYIARNPFRVLVSAINYSKVIYKKPAIRQSWADYGIDLKYFIDFLKMKSIPKPDEFNNYDISLLDNKSIEEILSKFIATKGVIPIFDKIGYFDHV